MRLLLFPNRLIPPLGYGWTSGMSFQGREEFSIARSSPIAGEYNPDPGPGILEIRDNSNQCNISNGEMVVPASATFANPAAILYSDNATLVAGMTSWIEAYYTAVLGDFRMNMGMSLGAFNPSHAYFVSTGNILTIAPAPEPSLQDTGEAIPAVNTAFRLIHIKRNTGTYYLFSVSPYTNYKLLRIEDTFADPPAGTALCNGFTTSTITRYIKNMAFIDLVGSGYGVPWSDQYALSTSRYAGSVSAGQTFTHPADCWIRWTQTTLPNAGQETHIRFRIQDASNYWFIKVTNAGVFSLNEVVAGVPTQRATDAVSAGQRIEIATDGTKIVGFTSGTYKWIYSSAANFQTATDGIVQQLGTGGSISNLEIWYRYLTGEAKASLDRVGAILA